MLKKTNAFEYYRQLELDLHSFMAGRLAKA